MKIFIVGLGPGNIDLISKKAYDLIFDNSIKKYLELNNMR